MDPVENKHEDQGVKNETPAKNPDEKQKDSSQNAVENAEIAKLREEFSKEMKTQLDEYKKAFDSALAEKEAAIAELTEQNKGLQRTLIRSALMNPPAHQPTTEEIYRKMVDDASKETLELMKHHYME